jgi:HD-like signal output (HDOD) protein
MSDTSSAAVQADTTPTHERTMVRIREGLKRLGDLPIFSTSINKVRRVSSDPNSDAMTVAKEVLKDANLSTKLLRLGNSAYYNRGVGKISVISRAVIMLGFETVRNVTLTLKLIESFQNANPDVDMSRMLVKSYLAAGFVRDLAERCGIKDIEESYVCALLHNLGEVTVAYVLPDEYTRIKDLIAEGRSPAAAENAVLGTSIYLISQDLAASWEFPATVVNTMAPPSEGGNARDKVSFNRSIASLSHRLLENLYSDDDDSEDLTETLERLSKATGLNDGLVENYLGESFRQSCTLASEYGLDKKLLKPPLGNAEGTLRNKWARQFSFLASRDEPPAAPEASALDGPPPPARAGPVAHPKSAPPRAARAKPPAVSDDAIPQTRPNEVLVQAGVVTGDHQLQLKIIQEITDLIAKSARLSEVFAKVLEGIHRGAGFERVLLCLVTPDRRRYVGRLGAGTARDVLRQYFSFSIDPSHDLFSRLLMKGGELIVDDASAARWGNLLPADFVQVTGANSFMVAALRFQDRPVGFFYADCAVSQRPISDEAQRNLLQFVTQARLALRLCS